MAAKFYSEFRSVSLEYTQNTADAADGLHRDELTQRTKTRVDFFA